MTPTLVLSGLESDGQEQFSELAQARALPEGYEELRYPQRGVCQAPIREAEMKFQHITNVPCLVKGYR